MKQIQTSTQTFEINPQEAEEVASLVEQIPNLPQTAKDRMKDLRDLARLIDQGKWDEFSLIVKVRRESYL